MKTGDDFAPATQQVAASSHVLQQRIETIRGKAWPEISNAAALALLLRVPTESEAEFPEGSLAERITVRVPDTAAANLAADARSFTVRRQHGTAHADEGGDFGDEPMLLFESLVTWRDADGEHQRTLRTIVCRTGLTRSGVFGSALGRPRGQ